MCRKDFSVYAMASREELLQSIRPDMKLDRAFFLKVYGYEISFPGFKDIAIKALNDAGCSRAEEYYNRIVSEYEKKHNEEIKNATGWYLKKCQDDWNRFVRANERTGEEIRDKKNMQNDYWKKRKERIEEFKRDLKLL